jgi:hypothetical protein
VCRTRAGATQVAIHARVAVTLAVIPLSTIHVIAPDWQPDRFLALMKWVEGQPLQNLVGVLTLYAEDLGEASAECLVDRWLLHLCAALGEWHRVGLVHGDVSPKNLIVQGGTIVLTDRAPFVYGIDRRKDPGLNWDGIADYATLRPFLGRAIHPDPLRRVPDALAACGFLANAAQETHEALREARH